MENNKSKKPCVYDGNLGVEEDSSDSEDETLTLMSRSEWEKEFLSDIWLSNLSDELKKYLYQKAATVSMRFTRLPSRGLLVQLLMMSFFHVTDGSRRRDYPFRADT